jgi:hypothetical protein
MGFRHWHDHPSRDTPSRRAVQRGCRRAAHTMVGAGEPDPVQRRRRRQARDLGDSPGSRRDAAKPSPNTRHGTPQPRSRRDQGSRRVVRLGGDDRAAINPPRVPRVYRQPEPASVTHVALPDHARGPYRYDIPGRDADRRRHPPQPVDLPPISPGMRCLAGPAFARRWPS